MCRFLLLLTMLIVFPAQAAELKADEYVRFIPGIAYDANGDEIEAEVNAFVYEKESRPLVTLALHALMDIDTKKLTPQQKQTLDERSALFRIDFEGNKTFAVRFADGSVHAMPESHDGKSARRVRLKKPETPQKEIHFTVDQPAFP
ncbi:MAG: hypothetical protein LBB51_05390, partial [Zoogloeaceae bacterium]|nr:hypothetical protein [Zoogloeaceae bacterium]